jgi:uncharacterized protein HemY
MITMKNRILIFFSREREILRLKKQCKVLRAENDRLYEVIKQLSKDQLMGSLVSVVARMMGLVK